MVHSDDEGGKMKKGFLFSILIALMLSMLLMLVQYSFAIKPLPDVSLDVQRSRAQSVLLLGKQLGSDSVWYSVSNGKVNVRFNQSAGMLSSINSNITELAGFLELFGEFSQQNISLSNTSANSWLGAGNFTLKGSGSDYHWDGDAFSLEHGGDYILLNSTVAEVNYSSWTPALGAAGDVQVRVLVNSYDSGVKYVSYGTQYDGFFNFTGGDEVNVTFDSSGNLQVDYSSVSVDYRQELEFEESELVMTFGGIEIDTSNTTDPGWAMPVISGTKHYGSSATENYVVVDAGPDGVYDYVFIDTDKDDNFTDDGALWYIGKGSIVDIAGEGFYITFENNGNWVKKDNALVVYGIEEDSTVLAAVKVLQ